MKPPKISSPSFVATFQVRVTPEDARVLDRRFELARLMFNTVLQSARLRLERFRTDPEYARLMAELKAWHARNERDGQSTLKSILKQLQDDRKLINDGFSNLRGKHRFTEYALHDVVKRVGHTRCHLGAFNQVDSQTAQKIASRAYRACNEVLTLGRGVPRYKPFSQPLGSLEGKSNEMGIMFKAADMTVRWKQLKLELIYDETDAYHVHAVQARTKYVRLLRRRVKGQWRYSAQLVCEGLPLQKRANKIASGIAVGIDMGPSTVAAVSQDGAILKEFCAGLDTSKTQLRVLNRHLERQRRANNPGNYEPDFTVQKGKKKQRTVQKTGQIKKGVKLRWVVSGTIRKTQDLRSELFRRQAEHRKTLHGEMTNDLLEMGTVFKIEKLSVKAWQKMWGKSVGNRAPGMFQEMLIRKAERAGGTVEWIDARQAKLSQRCVCGAVKKKSLSERVHVCSCGARVQRDLLSAYLALQTQGGRWCAADGVLFPVGPGVECLLTSAHLRAVEETAIGGRKVSSFGKAISQSRSGLTCNDLDVDVSRPRSLGETAEIQIPRS